MTERSLTAPIKTQHEIRVEHAGGLRLDRFLTGQNPKHSRSYFQRLIRMGMVEMHGKPCYASQKVQTGDIIQVSIPVERHSITPEAGIALDIISEDADVIVVNKMPGMVVHPAPGNRTGTLINALAAHGDALKYVQETVCPRDQRPGIVHRLDKDTSGVMVMAKTPEAFASLGKQFADRSVRKVYVAIVHGELLGPEAVIDLPIGRDPKNRLKMCVRPGGRSGRTLISVRKRASVFSLLEAQPQTGRTHQIRVHLSHIGHPVVGDRVYGNAQLDGTLKEPGVCRQMLHAWKLSFIHPRTNKSFEYTAPIPADFCTAWETVSGEQLHGLPQEI